MLCTDRTTGSRSRPESTPALPRSAACSSPLPTTRRESSMRLSQARSILLSVAAVASGPLSMGCTNGASSAAAGDGGSSTDSTSAEDASAPIDSGVDGNDGGSNPDASSDAGLARDSGTDIGDGASHLDG